MALRVFKSVLLPNNTPENNTRRVVLVFVVYLNPNHKSNFNNEPVIVLLDRYLDDCACLAISAHRFTDLKDSTFVTSKTIIYVAKFSH